MGEEDVEFGTEWLAGKIGIPKDMLVFFAGEVFCMVCAVLYYNHLSPEVTSAKVRHVVTLTLGLLIGYFSFGIDFSHLLIQSSMCYLAILIVPSHIVHIVVFVVAMLYLVILHLYRAFIIPEDILYSIDVSGPLMIITQKITSLGFSIYDGLHSNTDGLHSNTDCYHDNKDKQSDLQKRYRISAPPSALEYFSYVFYFQGIVSGPMSFYKDYIVYVEGQQDYNKKQESRMQNNNNNRTKCGPSPFIPVLQKLSLAGFWMIFHFTMKPSYPVTRNSDAEFGTSYSFLYLLWYMYISMLCCRAKYYVAFTLGDAICNASGFGFNGYDNENRPRWDLVTNVNVLGIEGATSFKVYLDNWNIQTATWLRHICYDRVPVLKKTCTFLLSAMWHGCYPGYYFTFLFGLCLSELAGKMRLQFRHLFQTSRIRRLVYSVLTWLCTHIFVSYMVVPFTVLHFKATVIFYNNMYWCIHIVTAVLLLLLSFIPSPIHQRASHRNTLLREATPDSVKHQTTRVMPLDENDKGFNISTLTQSKEFKKI